MTEVLGESVLYLRTDQTQLDTGLARAEGASVKSSGRMKTSMDLAARSTADAEVKLKSYQLAVDSAQTRVTQLGRALESGSGDQQKLNEALTLAQGRLSLAQAHMESYAGKVRNGAVETRSLSTETGISSRAFSDLTGHMGPVGRTLTDLTARSRLYRDHGIDYMAAGVIGLEGAFIGLSAKAAVNFEELGNKVRQQTGLTGGSLEELMGTIRGVAKDSPYRLQQVTDASVLLRTAFHETDRQVSLSANQMVAFAHYTGQDVTPQMQQLARIMGEYRQPLSQVVGLTDKLVSVTQATQQPTGELTATLDHFGPKLQALGFGLTDSVRLLALFQASGVKTDQMGRGLAATLTAAGAAQNASNKELADGPAKLAGYATGVQSAQLRVDELSSKLASGKGNQQLLNEQMKIAQTRLTDAKGKYDTLNAAITRAKGSHQDIAATIRSEIDQIVHANSKQDALNIAVGAFGKNLGPSMARAYYDNAAALAKVDKALKTTGATQRLFGVDQKSLAGETQIAKNAFQDLEITVGTKVLPALSGAMHWMDGAAHSVDDFYKHHQQLVDMALAVGGIGSALTLLSRHSPLGSILGRLFQTDSTSIAGGARRGIAGFLSGGGGSGISGSRGPIGAGSLANPIAVIGLGGGGDSPVKKIEKEIVKFAEKGATFEAARRAAQLALRALPGVSTAAGLVAAQEALNKVAPRALPSLGPGLPAPGLTPRAGLPAIEQFLSGAGNAIAGGPSLPGRFDMRSTGPSASSVALFDHLKLDAQQASLTIKMLGTTSASTFDLLARMTKRTNDLPFSFADKLASNMLRAKGVNRQVVGDMLTSLHKLPVDAQLEAANTAIGMAAQLQAKGALPRGSAEQIRKAITGSFTQMRVDSVAQASAMVTDAGKLIGAFGVSLEGFVNSAAAVFSAMPKPQQVGMGISATAAAHGITGANSGWPAPIPPTAKKPSAPSATTIADAFKAPAGSLGTGARTRIGSSSAKLPTPPAATSIPSQSIGAQTRMQELANMLTSSQNAGSTVGQQRALEAEIKLERAWLVADAKTQRLIEKALKNRHLSRAKHQQLLQDRFSVLQEIGTISGQIGSNTSTLTGLSGADASSGGFDLAPGGGGIKLPTTYDVLHGLGGAIPHKKAAPIHRPHMHNWSTAAARHARGAQHAAGGAHHAAAGPHIEVKPVFHINAASKPDADAIKAIVAQATAAMADNIDRSLRGRIHSQMRSAGMRGT